MLETKKLTKTYGNTVAVNGLDIHIKRGSFTAILGPNGAGKSTTIQMLIGLLQPTSGSINYAEKTKLGVVFQNSVLDGMLTVKENLEIRAKQYKHIEKNKIDQLIKELGLTNFVQQKYHTLSGGQKRRVDIARALLNSPDILFLDEPTTGLDIQTRNVIWDLLIQLQKEKKMTVVLTTHYLNEADNADMIYVVDHGKVIARGSADYIKLQYACNLLKIVTKTRDVFIQILKNHQIDYEELKSGEFLMKPEDIEQTFNILGWTRPYIEQFEFRQGTMDDAFIALTGKEVR
ncbi:MAG: ABC transporter ATP-binding protein [Streptococcus sp.]|nr:ABC transporter ATP-binding protein [Streptococcus sp.]